MLRNNLEYTSLSEAKFPSIPQCLSNSRTVILQHSKATSIIGSISYGTLFVQPMIMQWINVARSLTRMTQIGRMGDWALTVSYPESFRP